LKRVPPVRTASACQEARGSANGARGGPLTPYPFPRRGAEEREQRLTTSLASRGGLRAMIIYGKTAGKSPHANHRERCDGQADGHECPRGHRRFGGPVVQAFLPVPPTSLWSGLLTRPPSPTTARHNAVSSSKTACFPGEWTTPCHFSNWRAVGGMSPKTPELPVFFHSAPFRVVARCGARCSLTPAPLPRRGEGWATCMGVASR